MEPRLRALYSNWIDASPQLFLPHVITVLLERTQILCGNHNLALVKLKWSALYNTKYQRDSRPICTQFGNIFEFLCKRWPDNKCPTDFDEICDWKLGYIHWYVCISGCFGNTQPVAESPPSLCFWSKGVREDLPPLLKHPPQKNKLMLHIEWPQECNKFW